MQCSPCERGRFNSQRIAAKCRPCPSGTYSATGATECLVCGLRDVSQRTVTAGQHLAVAPKELRSSFITFLRSGDNSDAALKSAAFAMRHSSTQARGPAYDKERVERLSAAAVQVATDFAAGFK